ncbi:MAG: NTP/NDP exchange transporter [Puniceicoccales bacterium]|nr:NTP/NDP exchange transporter [Puniceicoccales bacterium]
MKANVDCEFSTLRGIFFPIYRYELKKIIPLGIILFITLFNHYCLKNIKDSLIVTNIGAEALAFTKLFCVPPGAILCMLLYTKLSDKLKNEHLFYVTLLSFLCFFAFFAFCLYPHRSFFHPSQDTIIRLQVMFPGAFWFFSILGVWSYAIFFVLAELWSSFMLTLLFWQFVNQITELKEAKRIYAFLAIIGQGAVALSGFVGTIASDLKNNTSEFQDLWQITLNYLIGIVIITSIIVMFLYHWIHKHVLTDRRFYNKPHLPGIKIKKVKSSVWKSLKMAITSPYLGLIALLLICYGINDNILENFWKHELKNRFPNINQYNTFMCQYTMHYGLSSIFVLIIAGNVFRRFKWGIGAMVTPCIVTLGGIIIFGSIFAKDYCIQCLGSALAHQTLVIFAGVTVIIGIKSSKMSFFDLSKEMAYIPLDEEMKVKGKAVVDVLGYRFGKSGGSGLQVVLLTCVTLCSGTQATYESIAPYAFIIFLLTSYIWFIAVSRLSRKIGMKSQTFN